jgi:hypothetical protein
VFYGRKAGVHKAPDRGKTLADRAFADRVVLKIVLLDQMLVADLSPHNPGALTFFRRVEQTPGYKDLLARTQYSSKVSMWERMVDADDCSVARGVGLAIAHSHLRGLSVQTVRSSGRAPQEKGDNLVLFGRAGAAIAGLSVKQASYFDARTGIESFPVQYP